MIASEQFAVGRIIREPMGFADGHWAGAPGHFFEPAEQAHYLTYRIRRPRGASLDRGGEARIARSTDGENFEDIWSVTKDKYGSASIERSAIRKGPDGRWRYYTSYVDPADGRWCVDLLTASSVAGLNPADRRRIFSASELGLEGIKDPWILETREGFQMFLSVAIRTPRTTGWSHETLDIFNTGDCLSATGLAFSRDLDQWTWQGVVFAPTGNGWDGYCRRINSVVPVAGKFLGFYDGSASARENYEEKTALAVSNDLRAWRSLSPGGPFVTSPHASGSIRYIDAQRVGGRVFIFYEFARADGSHDLRLIQTDPGDLARVITGPDESVGRW